MNSRGYDRRLHVQALEQVFQLHLRESLLLAEGRCLADALRIQAGRLDLGRDEAGSRIGDVDVIGHLADRELTVASRSSGVHGTVLAIPESRFVRKSP